MDCFTRQSRTVMNSRYCTIRFGMNRIRCSGYVHHLRIFQVHVITATAAHRHLPMNELQSAIVAVITKQCRSPRSLIDDEQEQGTDPHPPAITLTQVPLLRQWSPRCDRPCLPQGQPKQRSMSPPTIISLLRKQSCRLGGEQCL